MLIKLKNKILRFLDHRFCPNKQPSLANKLRWLEKLDLDSIIDIGANEGQFLESALEAFPGKPVCCFEPLEEAANKLQEKTRSISGVRIKRLALGNHNGKITINHCGFSPSSSILEMKKLHKEAFPFTASMKSKEEIRIARLDDIMVDMPEFKRPFIKIDTQGYEMEIMNGGIQTLARSPVIMLEVSYAILYEKQPLFREIYDRLTSLGFGYGGNIDQLLDPRDLRPLQADAIFIKNEQPT